MVLHARGPSAPRRTLLEWFIGGMSGRAPTTRLASALASPDDGTWHDWLLRAADELGWEADRVEASPSALEGERDSWWVSCASGEPERWLVVTGARHEQARASILDAQGAEDVPMRAKRFAKVLGLESVDEECVWVRLTPALPLESLRSPASGPRLTPLERLSAWAKLERRTLLAVVAYSAIIGLISLALPLAVQWLVNLLAFGRVLQPLLVVSVGLLIVLSLAAALRVIEVYIVELLERRVFADLARDFARRLPAATKDAGGKWGLTERINRFFDVVGAQKTSASLLLSATEVVMSTAAGLLILAFYHPYLIVFDLAVIASLALVVRRLGRGGIDSAVEESYSKYELAAWLESVARQQDRFVTPVGASWSARQTDRLLVKWLENRDAHFGVVLRQTIGFAAIQALASAALLGLGSYLVWIGELSLGQLVAAELIITGVMAQLAKLGRHAEAFYDLCASVDKLGLLIDCETEPKVGDLLPIRREGMRVELVDAALSTGCCTFVAEPGGRVAIAGMPHADRRAFFDMIYARREPDEGRVVVDGVIVSSLAPRPLRAQVALLREPRPVGATLEDNLTGQDAQSTARELRELLVEVGLGSLAAEQRDGLSTWIHPDGAPLEHWQLVAIEVARALRARPRLILVDGALDAVDDGETLDRLWSALARPDAPWTLVVASERQEILGRCDERFEWPAQEAA